MSRPLVTIGPVTVPPGRPFPIGSRIVLKGPNAGRGYVWRVDGYHGRWNGERWDDATPNVVCTNLGPLHGKAAPGDYHVGGTFHYDPADFVLLGSVKPPLQLDLAL